MYRIKKVLNHNSIIGIASENHHEYLIMGKGIGFGKKIAERIEPRPDDTIYSLQETTERGDVKDLACSVQPVFLEIANAVLIEAEKTFHTLDRNVLFPMADHLEFAVKRIQNHEEIHNPLTDDIRVLFHLEFKTAEHVRPILKEKLNISITDDEVGYLALHIHSAIQDQNVSQAMKIAQAVRECISLVEQETGKPIDVMSLSYNRLMNHIRNMVARALTGEKLKLNMNDYIEIKFPQAFESAKFICKQIEKDLKCEFCETEIGYLAMHIEQVTNNELDS